MACERRRNIYLIGVPAGPAYPDGRCCGANCSIQLKKAPTELVNPRDTMRCGIRKRKKSENAPAAADGRGGRGRESVFLLLAEGRRYLCGEGCR